MSEDRNQQNMSQDELDNLNKPFENENRSRNTDAEEKPEDNDGVYLTGSSKLQSPEEYEKDKNSKPYGEEDSLTVPAIDEDKGDQLGGSDRAGTAERAPDSSTINRDPESAQRRDEKMGNL